MAQILAACALLAARLCPQARHPCLGTVVDDADKALAGAAVTLVWSPGQGAPGVADVVQVTADERGRFKADVVAGHSYSAWAIGPARGNGSRLVSEVTDRAAAGRVVELAAWHLWRPRRVRCTGFEPWIGGAPPRLQLLPDARHTFAIALGDLKDGVIDVPPTPWTTAGIGLLDDAGIAQVQPLEPEDDAVAFKARREVAVKVVDEKGQPVAGAVVEHDLPRISRAHCGDGMFVPASLTRWRVAARTGADGVAGFAVPDIRNLNGIVSWVRATTPGGVRVHAPVTTAGPPQDGPLVMRAQPGEAMRCRVHGIGDDEIASAELDAAMTFSLPKTNYGLAIGVPLTVDAHHVLGGPTPAANLDDVSLVLHLLPRARGTPRYAFVAPAAASPPLLPNVDLATLRTCRIAALDEHNNPQPGCEVALFPAGNTQLSFATSAMPLVLDHAGRADVLLDRAEWAVYVTDGSAHALEFVDEGTQPRNLQVQLQPMPTLRLRVVDRHGQPVRGARAESSPRAFKMSGRDQRAKVRERIGARIADRIAYLPSSDGSGRLVLPVQDWCPVSRTVLIRAGALQSDWIPFAASPDEQTVVVK